MHHFFATHRQELEAFLHTYIQQKRESYLQTHTWSDDVFTRLDTFAVRGKLLRGLLVYLAAHSFSKNLESSVVETAAAIELFHSGVLIHDDIIDQDALRRGQPSVHAQYQQLATERDYKIPQHTGQSLALCVGDIGLFLSFELLTQVDVSDAQLRRLQGLFIDELVQVGLAEMEDVRMSVTSENITEDQIQTMYAYKTGRYSIYLPLAIGTLLAQADPEFLPVLEKLGETMGVVMQLKDDELGLFGTEAETGKPVISDVREGKHTLYYLYALQMATPAQLKVLRAQYGNPAITVSELEQVRAVIKESGAYDKVQAYTQGLQSEATSLVTSLPIAEKMWPVWQDLLALQTTRKK